MCPLARGGRRGLPCARLSPTTGSVRAAIAEDEGLRELFAALCARGPQEPGHDLAHSLRVAAWTLELLPAPTDRRGAIAAALLHDLVNVPKDSPARAQASELSAEAARPLLTRAGFAPVDVDAICGAIRDHSFSSGRAPASELGRALQDADRLEALGALGVLRTASTGVALGAVYFHPDDPWASSRSLDDRAYTVDHFFTKLLGLPARMGTPRGRAEAERRVAFLRRFLEELAVEIGHPLPPG